MYFLVQPGKTGHDFRKETEVSLKGRVDGNVKCVEKPGRVL